MFTSSLPVRYLENFLAPMDDFGSGVWDDAPSSSTRPFFEQPLTTSSPFASEPQDEDESHSVPAKPEMPEPLEYSSAFSSVPSVSNPTPTNSLNGYGGFGHAPILPPAASSSLVSNPLLSSFPASPSPFDTDLPSGNKASDPDDFYLRAGIGSLRLAETRASADNASIIPIPPSETGTIGSVDDDAEARGPLSLHSAAAHSAWGQEPPSVTTTKSSGTSGFFDPLQHAVDDHYGGASMVPEALAAKENIQLSRSDVPSGQTSSTNEPTFETSEYEFDVSVSEPQKIGDPLSAHVSYKVRTKTNAPGFRNLDFTVSRRYRDFLWLYNQLTIRYPGVIVPPVPEKHAIGRFQDDFVESRRFALERCIKKIVSHPLLQLDEDVKMFLESESFAVDKKRDDTAKGGLMAAFNTAMSTAAAITTSRIDNDQIFEGRRDQIDAVEGQLRALLKALESLSKYRKDLGSATYDFGESMIALASVEVNKPVASNLVVLGNIQKKIKEIHDKQAKQDMYHIISVVDEHIRIISSVKTSESNFIRKKEVLDRVKSTAKVRLDKISVGSSEVAELEKQLLQSRKAFDDTTTLLRVELDRYEKEKIVDFTIAIQGFLRSLIETQKEIIALWQTYQVEASQPSDPISSSYSSSAF
ncbi:Vacuolar protein sorting-associated protein 5 [Dinochytrium kinnereticum]|nr:Vacuolar protein sorting-associated protein 5 [Dinochytrium kinnereticum]